MAAAATLLRERAMGWRSKTPWAELKSFSTPPTLKTPCLRRMVQRREPRLMLAISANKILSDWGSSNSESSRSDPSSEPALSPSGSASSIAGSGTFSVSRRTLAPPPGVAGVTLTEGVLFATWTTAPEKASSKSSWSATESSRSVRTVLSGVSSFVVKAGEIGVFALFALLALGGGISELSPSSLSGLFLTFVAPGAGILLRSPSACRLSALGGCSSGRPSRIMTPSMTLPSVATVRGVIGCGRGVPMAEVRGVQSEGTGDAASLSATTSLSSLRSAFHFDLPSHCCSMAAILASIAFTHLLLNSSIFEAFLSRPVVRIFCTVASMTRSYDSRSCRIASDDMLFSLYYLARRGV
mmetsp:Transcript_24749/g.53815  ORF Transcript_24749/g.53815 Transcript_24749/m.53815 type:complete len:354 (+) Transcript_24749:261-1322(+)